MPKPHQELILPVENDGSRTIYTIYREKGPVDFIDYHFTDGSTVLTAALHVDDSSIVPLRPRVQAVRDKYNNQISIEEKPKNGDHQATIAHIWSAVEALILAEAEANTPPKEAPVLVGYVAVK